jgi:hypothetical protein
MKVSACYIVHYGLEWLYWSIRSVIGYVDDVHIFYTPTPSHGHGTTLECPETRKDIGNSIAGLFADYGNIFWHDTDGFAHEGLQRHHAVDVCVMNGADIILVVDHDEIWPPDVLIRALDYVENDTSGAQGYCIGMRHFWRSTYWVCDDACMPTRLIRPGNPNQHNEYLGDSIGKVFHMGYAQSPRIVEYKQTIHGHLAEWRQGWFEKRFLAWSPENPLSDCHPTNVDFWMPKHIDIEDPAVDFKAMHELCFDHPYWKVPIITNESFRA